MSQNLKKEIRAWLKKIAAWFVAHFLCANLQLSPCSCLRMLPLSFFRVRRLRRVVLPWIIVTVCWNVFPWFSITFINFLRKEFAASWTSTFFIPRSKFSYLICFGCLQKPLIGGLCVFNDRGFWIWHALVLKHRSLDIVTIMDRTKLTNDRLLFIC